MGKTNDISGRPLPQCVTPMLGEILSQLEKHPWGKATFDDATTHCVHSLQRYEAIVTIDAVNYTLRFDRNHYKCEVPLSLDIMDTDVDLYKGLTLMFHISNGSNPIKNDADGFSLFIQAIQLTLGRKIDSRCGVALGMSTNVVPRH